MELYYEDFALLLMLIEKRRWAPPENATLVERDWIANPGMACPYDSVSPPKKSKR
jgi:hypothetical protein